MFHFKQLSATHTATVHGLGVNEFERKGQFYATFNSNSLKQEQMQSFIKKVTNI